MLEHGGNRETWGSGVAVFPPSSIRHMLSSRRMPPVVRSATPPHFERPIHQIMTHEDESKLHSLSRQLKMPRSEMTVLARLNRPAPALMVMAYPFLQTKWQSRTWANTRGDVWLSCLASSIESTGSNHEIMSHKSSRRCTISNGHALMRWCVDAKQNAVLHLCFNFTEEFLWPTFPEEWQSSIISTSVALVRLLYRQTCQSIQREDIFKQLPFILYFWGGFFACSSFFIVSFPKKLYIRNRSCPSTFNVLYIVFLLVYCQTVRSQKSRSWEYGVDTEMWS